MESRNKRDVACLSTTQSGPPKRNGWLASRQLASATSRSRIGIVFWRGEAGVFDEGDIVRRERCWMLDRETATLCITHKEGT